MGILAKFPDYDPDSKYEGTRAQRGGVSILDFVCSDYARIVGRE